VEINLLRSLLKIECRDYHIIKAVVAIKDIDTIDLSSFENSLKEITHSESIKDHLVKWKIIIPFDINPKKRNFTVNGITFKILSYSTIRKYYPLEFHHYYKELKLETRKIENKKSKYLVVDSDGSSLYRAWKGIEPTFNLLRGLFDFLLSFNSWTFFSTSHIRTKIPHPQTVFGMSSESHADFLDFLVQKSDHKQVEITSKIKLSFEKYLRVLKKRAIKNSFNELLSDIFRLYSSAMEENDLQYGFLKFWQIAERLALTTPNGISSDTIKKRITYFTDPTPEFDLSPYIDKLATKRNELVHRGIEDVEETDFNILKSICERAIVWLFVNRNNFKTINHLESFYTSKSLSKTEIKATIDTLTFIKKQRSK
jgi:hypothetical protein